MSAKKTCHCTLSGQLEDITTNGCCEICEDGWSRWFAWRPVVQTNGDIAWFTFVERCWYQGWAERYSCWVYRRNG